MSRGVDKNQRWIIKWMLKARFDLDLQMKGVDLKFGSHRWGWNQRSAITIWCKCRALIFWNFWNLHNKIFTWNFMWMDESARSTTITNKISVNLTQDI